jgi:predicted heme/steroid binding protein
VEDISYLKQTFFDHVNGNGVPDDNEEVSDEYVRYYLGDKEVTVDEYVGAMIEGEYKNLQGEMDLYDIYRLLQKPDLVKIKDKKCREAYLQIIEQFEKDTEEDMSRSYALIDFDGDDTLELICQRGGHRISFYVYEDGNVYQLMDDWSWGAGANHGYEYIPGKNIYKNNDSNAGENIVTFKKLNDNNKLELMYYLVVEWGEYKKDGIDRYYKGTQDGEVEITEAEYKELMIEGNFRLIEAWYSREEIESCLR